jgi:hypothetical protein
MQQSLLLSIRVAQWPRAALGGQGLHMTVAPSQESLQRQAETGSCQLSYAQLPSPTLPMLLRPNSRCTITSDTIGCPDDASLPLHHKHTHASLSHVWAPLNWRVFIAANCMQEPLWSAQVQETSASIQCLRPALTWCLNHPGGHREHDSSSSSLCRQSKTMVSHSEGRVVGG